MRISSGFTLIELLITMTIALILLSVGVPSLSMFLNKIRLNSMSNSIVSSLNQARSEAGVKNSRVLVCASNAAGTDCTASTNWGATGWLVCYDNDDNGTCDTSTTTKPNPIRRDKPIDTSLGTITGPSAGLYFNSDGSQGIAGAATAMISVTGTWSGAKTLTITVAGTGLIKGQRL